MTLSYFLSHLFLMKISNFSNIYLIYQRGYQFYMPQGLIPHACILRTVKSSENSIVDKPNDRSILQKIFGDIFALYSHR